MSIGADFDRLALLDDEGWTANNHYHNLLLRYVPQSCRNALEIGCGTGTFARRLAEKCKHVIALDLSSEMIRIARSRSSRFANLEFQLADATTWDFPKSHFDFVCSIATLHHLNQRDLFPRIRDSLKPGGVLAVLDLVESNSWIERLLDFIALGNEWESEAYSQRQIETAGGGEKSVGATWQTRSLFHYRRHARAR